jgi:acetyltransferase-like isoleucine patch superfamily enzyme
MSALLSVRERIVAARTARWRAGARLRLQSAGARLSVEAPDGFSFASPPRLEPTRVRAAGSQAGRGGTLTLRLGPGVELGHGTIIEYTPEADSVLELGERVTLGSGVRLALLGGTVRLGPYSRIRDGVLVKCSGVIDLGRETYLQERSGLSCAERISGGDRVTLAERAHVHDSDHQVTGDETWHMELPVVSEPVDLGANTLISAAATVLRGARLGRNSLVAAGAVVRAGRYPDGWLLAGTPAKPIKALGEK